MEREFILYVDGRYWTESRFIRTWGVSLVNNLVTKMEQGGRVVEIIFTADPEQVPLAMY